MITLEAAAKDWWLDNKENWTQKNAKYILDNFERYIFNDLGNIPLDQIKPSDVLSVIKKAEKSAPTVARRLLQRMILIFDIAVIQGHCVQNPARPVPVALKKISGGEFAVLSERELPRFYREIDRKSWRQTANTRAFWTLQYTALRRSECVLAKKTEVNLKQKLWVIPAERMKNNKPHVVPLSSQLCQLLDDCIRENRSKWLFPSPRKKNTHINPFQPLYLIRKAGYEKRMTIHGARKVFSTLAHESGLFSVDAIELQLSHNIPGVRGIYNKAMLLEERRELMQWWSDKLDAMRGQ